MDDGIAILDALSYLRTNREPFHPMPQQLSALERDWPQKVVMPFPPGGFGWRLPHLLWAARNCGSPRHWQEGDGLAFAFYDAIDTAQFRDWLARSAIAWNWPVEWPQIQPAPPLGAPREAHTQQHFDREAMSDWVRDALRRGHARRVIGAYLRGNRRGGAGRFGAMGEATRELASLRPDLDPALHKAMVETLRDWTLKNHRDWFIHQLQRHARNQ